MYSLLRESDGAGDSGGMSLLMKLDENKKIVYDKSDRPKIGYAIRVGAFYARSYTAQDWWQTSIITEIIEDTENYVKFRTGNSVYEWKDD